MYNRYRQEGRPRVLKLYNDLMHNFSTLLPKEKVLRDFSTKSQGEHERNAKRQRSVFTDGCNEAFGKSRIKPYVAMYIKRAAEIIPGRFRLS